MTDIRFSINIGSIPGLTADFIQHLRQPRFEKGTINEQGTLNEHASYDNLQ